MKACLRTTRRPSCGCARPLSRGQVKAQLRLGGNYRLGEGVPTDDAKTVLWYRKAAEQGDADAEGLLGVMYENGWACLDEQGNIHAQYNLGNSYYIGRGIPQDYVQAHMWLNLSAALSDNDRDRDLAAKRRDLVTSKMTPAQIAKAEKLAVEWKPTLVLKPNPSMSHFRRWDVYNFCVAHRR